MNADAPVALFDLDGTLADFDGAMRAGMRALSHPNEMLSAELPETDDEPPHLTARRRLIKRQPGFWTGLKRLDLGFKLLDHAVACGYRISVLTKAPRTNFPAWSEKVAWCHAHLPMDKGVQVNLVEDKGLVYGKVLVDDWPLYIESWLQWRPRGLVLMPAQPWNESFAHPQVLRVTMANVAVAENALERQAIPVLQAG
jgi:5'-nucleotidase